jgi:hypothetical protein
MPEDETGKTKQARPVVTRMLGEIDQSHETRRPLIEKIEKKLSRNVITFFTSTRHPVAIEDVDNDMIEGMLQVADRNKGLSLILNSPGGSALAAERIINTCRTYSGGDFEVIVPRIAKSAATMICMGANKIWMSKTSELGPIDPQVVIMTREGTYQLRGAFYIIESYEKLFGEATQTKGNIQPYLQQLERYDTRDIEEYKTMMELGVDMVIKALKASMMKGKTDDEIRQKIEPFTNPTKTKTHGRPIYIDEVTKSGLIVEEIAVRSDEWSNLWDLYLRSNTFVNSPNASKLCESVNDSFIAAAPKFSEG